MKRVYLNLKIALRSLYSFKLRTALAVLGVFLGTFSLILVSNLTGSLSRMAEMEVEKLGKNLLVVRSGTVMRFGSNTRLLSEATNLSLADAAAIVDASPYVEKASPASSKEFSVRSERTTLSSIPVAGVAPDFPSIRNFNVKDGRFFSDDDNESLGRVAVLGKKVANKLFGGSEPLGKYILIYRVPCQVIGIMEEKGVDISNVDQDNQIFIPINTFLRRFVNKDFVNTLYVRTVSVESMPLAREQIEATLRKRHKIQPGRNDDFGVVDQKDVMAIKNQATSMITILGRIAASVSFSIGALGILSIMILIVNERRLEIGIRRAVGSRKRDIILQFLMESSFISLVGGMVGVLFGFLISVLIFSLSKLPFSISVTGFILSFAASVTVGILAGIYPSRKATTIQPVDVIRS